MGGMGRRVVVPVRLVVHEGVHVFLLVQGLKVVVDVGGVVNVNFVGVIVVVGALVVFVVIVVTFGVTFIVIVVVVVVIFSVVDIPVSCQVVFVRCCRRDVVEEMKKRFCSEESEKQRSVL